MAPKMTKKELMANIAKKKARDKAAAEELANRSALRPSKAKSRTKAQIAADQASKRKKIIAEKKAEEKQKKIADAKKPKPKKRPISLANQIKIKANKNRATSQGGRSAAEVNKKSQPFRDQPKTKAMALPKSKPKAPPKKKTVTSKSKSKTKMYTAINTKTGKPDFNAPKVTAAERLKQEDAYKAYKESQKLTNVFSMSTKKGK